MTDTERVEQATRSYLEDNPDQKETLSDLLDHEENQGSWAFDDASLDSGNFGELVSRSFVEKTDDGTYRFVDRETVAAVLRGEEVKTEPTETKPLVDRSLPAVDMRVVAGILTSLALVAIARSLYIGSVFRDGHVVSPANDPYFYRYWQAELLEHSSSAADFGTFATVGELTRIRPLTHALNWWFAALTGSPDLVAAFQPIVASLVLALAVYGLTHTLTADHRIALGAVLLLALTPVHAVYTGMGFLEHRPYQYLWVGVMAFSLGWLAVDLTRRHRADVANPGLEHARNPRAWVVAAILAISVGGMAHTWGGSPLSFVPIAVYLGFRVVADCREGINPTLANGPALGGVIAGSLLAAMAHLRWDWHESIAVTVPLVIAIGGITVAVIATLWLRLELPPAGLLVTEGVLATIGTLLFWQLRPEDVTRLQERSAALFDRETATETASLFTTEYAVIFGPLGQIGIGFYLALIPLGFATYYVAREYDPGWLAAVCFAWFYLVLATIQVRFAAQFSIFCAVFGAVGLVYLIGAADLIRSPTMLERTAPEGRGLELPKTPKIGAYLVAVIAGLLVFNLIFVPTLMAQTQYTDEQFETALIIDGHADELDRQYPASFVLSEWGENRMYNYFVSGESRGYGYAQSNYAPFITDTEPDTYYDQFSDRVGYVVLNEVDATEESIHARLFDDFGAGPESTGHYQLLYAEGDVRAFVVVKGATIETSGDANTTVTVTTDVEAGGKQFTYNRTATGSEDGTAHVRVAYPGTYEVGNERVHVTETDVYQGATVEVNEE